MRRLRPTDEHRLILQIQDELRRMAERELRVEVEVEVEVD